MFRNWRDATPVQAIPGITRRTLATGERGMLVEFRALAGAAIPIHHHPAEQDGYLVSGAMVIIIDGVEHQVQPGDSYAILADAPHGARFLAESVVVEAFSPPREDYRG